MGEWAIIVARVRIPMWDLLQRWRKRQYDLQSGADADLVRDNRRRFRLAGLLFGFSFLLMGAQAAYKFQGPLHEIVVALTTISLVGALLFSRWAMAESAFLSRPDPKQPPKLWKQ